MQRQTFLPDIRLWSGLALSASPGAVETSITTWTTTVDGAGFLPLSVSPALLRPLPLSGSRVGNGAETDIGRAKSEPGAGACISRGEKGERVHQQEPSANPGHHCTYGIRSRFKWRAFPPFPPSPRTTPRVWGGDTAYIQRQLNPISIPLLLAPDKSTGIALDRPCSPSYADRFVS